jgi:hypothetical protein
MLARISSDNAGTRIHLKEPCSTAKQLEENQNDFMPDCHSRQLQTMPGIQGLPAKRRDRRPQTGRRNIHQAKSERKGEKQQINFQPQSHVQHDLRQI